MTLTNRAVLTNFHPDYDRVLQLWDRGEDVKHLQMDLIAAGESMVADGIYGPHTRHAVMRLQTKHNLVTDGVAGPKVYQALHPTKSLARLLKHSDLVEASCDLGVPLAAIMAVNTVESRGSGFFNNGLPVILYERHIMYRRLKHHQQNAMRLAQQHPKLVNRRWGGYSGGPKEHVRLNAAKELHVAAALESASWGAFQIMGFHHQHLGYNDVFEFVDLMHLSEKNQLDAFVRFIKADGRLHTAIKDLDWATFARIYNGPAYAKNKYDVKMAEAYGRYVRDGQRIA